MLNRTQNPTEGGKEPRSYGTSSNVVNDMLGFINRNKETSESISAPSPIFPLGTDLVLEMSKGSWIPSSIADKAKFAAWDPASARGALPGILTYEFEPLFGQTNEYGVKSVGDIFTNKWIEIRQVYTGADNFEPGNIQIMSIGQMLIDMHIANIQRFINMIAAVSNDPENHYFTVEALTSAYGFPMTDVYARKHWVEFKNFYNDSILGKLSKIKWIADLVPGRKRWASLCKEFYKDNDFATKNVQMAFMKPASFWKMEETVDPDTKATDWTFTQESMYTGEVDDISFSAYMNKVSNLIDTLYYDSGNINVLNGIIAMINNGNRKGLGDVEVYSLSDDYQACSKETASFELTYNFTMQLALHNATIMNGVVPEAPIFDRSTGAVYQNVHATGQMPASRLAYASKIVNMPQLYNSNSDFAAITPWTVACMKWPESVLTIFPPNAFGTEVITSAAYHYYVAIYDQSTHRYTYSLYKTMINQLIGASIGNSTDAQQLKENRDALLTDIQMLSKLSAFALAPIIYVLAGSDTYPLALSTVVGEMEIPFCANGHIMEGIHKVWFNNFWGFPISPANGEGAPELTLKSGSIG
jgi:hypothetical protein